MMAELIDCMAVAGTSGREVVVVIMDVHEVAVLQDLAITMQHYHTQKQFARQLLAPQL